MDYSGVTSNLMIFSGCGMPTNPGANSNSIVLGSS